MDILNGYFVMAFSKFNLNLGDLEYILTQSPILLDVLRIIKGVSGMLIVCLKALENSITFGSSNKMQTAQEYNTLRNSNF